MTKNFVCALAAVYVLASATCASAANMVVRGTIVSTQGHESPACRYVVIRRKSDAAILTFRIPVSSTENGILPVTIAAVVTGREVDVTFDPTLTSGCGGEPRIIVISINAAGF